MRWLMEKWQTEPVMVIDTVKTVILLIASLGFELTKEQDAALIAVLLAFSRLTRSQVRPVDRSVPQ